LKPLESSTHRVLRVGQVCFVMWVIGDLVTSCHGVLAATELVRDRGQVKVHWVVMVIKFGLHNLRAEL